MRAGSPEPALTPRSPPQPSSTSASWSKTSTSRPVSAPRTWAISAMRVADRCIGGVFARSRATWVASAGHATPGGAGADGAPRPRRPRRARGSSGAPRRAGCGTRDTGSARGGCPRRRPGRRHPGPRPRAVAARWRRPHGGTWRGRTPPRRHATLRGRGRAASPMPTATSSGTASPGIAIAWPTAPVKPAAVRASRLRPSVGGDVAGRGDRDGEGGGSGRHAGRDVDREPGGRAARRNGIEARDGARRPRLGGGHAGLPLIGRTWGRRTGDGPCAGRRGHQGQDRRSRAPTGIASRRAAGPARPAQEPRTKPSVVLPVSSQSWSSPSSRIAARFTTSRAAK